MIPVSQTILNHPNGDCMRAAVASIMELQIEAVPNFALYRSHWLDKLLIFLAGYGLGLMSVSYTPEIFEHFREVGYHILVVRSPRGNYNHALVAHNGQPVHDPYPGGACSHAGIISAEFFIVLDASTAAAGALVSWGDE